MEWSTEVTEADWWINRLQPFRDHVVGSMIPAGFEAITRIFNPIDDDGRTETRWSDVAAANGRVAHGQMQLHRIASQVGEPVDDRARQPHVWWGGIPAPEARALARVLTSTGSSGPTWFGFTTINSTYDPPTGADWPAAGTRSRKYYLIRSTLSELDEVSRFASGDPAERGHTEAPTVWWPQDRSWYVFSDVDFAWSYVAGSTALIEAIEDSPELEAIRSAYDHRGTFDADTINTP
jgi:hypothetical protein